MDNSLIEVLRRSLKKLGVFSAGRGFVDVHRWNCETLAYDLASVMAAENFIPEHIRVIVGNVEIESDDMILYGSKIRIDGKEVPGLTALKLEGSIDAAWQLTISTIPQKPKAEIEVTTNDSPDKFREFRQGREFI